MLSIKDPTKFEPRRGVLFHCPVCGQDAELYASPAHVEGDWPVKRKKDGSLYVDFTDCRELLNVQCKYACFTCGATFPFDEKLIGKLLKDEET